MELSSSLLVALMFVTILGMAVANLIMGLAVIVNQNPSSRPTLVHLSWIGLLLLSAFNMFWQSLAILEIDEWSFPGFLFMMTGPILVVFAADASLRSGTGDADTNKRQLYLAASGNFFPMFAMAHIWVVLAGMLLFGGFEAPDVSSVFLAGVSLYLWRQTAYEKHVAGARFAWAGTVIFGMLYALGIFG